MNLQANAVHGENDLIEWIGALVKPKLLFVALQNAMLIGLVGLWMVTAVWVTQAYKVWAEVDAPTTQRVEDHVEYLQKQVDGINQDALERRQLSEKRWDDLNKKLDGMQATQQETKEKINFIYGWGAGGIGLTTVLVSFGIIKIVKKEAGSHLTLRDPEDEDALDLYLAEAQRVLSEKRLRKKGRL